MDIYRIYQAVETLPDVRALLLGYKGQHADTIHECFILPLEESIGNFSKYREMVQATIDLPLAENRGEFAVKPEFDPSLKGDFCMP
ncbi:unnamed protein product [Protopolystoma xenopodis]|uniref:Uncharacterized protein n=1 Tax=Protopolystoma xenopodis TaxID=117903 RepID=A0A448XEM5_9PLAT|nr:unnamed protein product [Protopolystoma xenopodis]